MKINFCNNFDLTSLASPAGARNFHGQKRNNATHGPGDQ